MQRKVKKPLADLTTWLLIGGVFLGIAGILMGILMHEKEKPQSPQAVVVAAFNRIFTAMGQNNGEWKPLPFQNTVGFNDPVWQPLPGVAGSVQQIGSYGGMQPGMTKAR
jgi:hypothetical protein